MKFAMLDVGHGSCAVLHEGGRAVMIDCPPGATMRTYLREAQIVVVEDLVISHAHKDHCGGLVSLMKSGVHINRIWICDDQSNKTLNYETIMRAFEAARFAGSQMRRDYPHADTDPVAFDGISMEFLSPRHEHRARKFDANTMSVMCRLRKGRVGVVVLPADLDLEGFERSFDANRDYSATWLGLPHHGGLCGTVQETVHFILKLIELVGAREVFASFARDFHANVPRKEVLEAVGSVDGVNLRCSQLSVDCGGCVSSPDVSFPYAVSAGLGVGTTCAGSVVLDLEDSLDWADAASHDGLVDRTHAPRCR